MRILPPTNTSKLMRRSRSALQRAVMSRRSCSRCRMRRRSWWLVLCSGVASYSSAEESERMCSGTSSVPKIFSGSKSRMKTKEGESWDCGREQEKGLRRRDYSRMVRFFGGALFSSSGCFPLSAMALGVFL
jgi:hypothetical protein